MLKGDCCTRTSGMVAIAGALLLSVCSWAESFALQTGHLYGVYGSGVREYDANLHVVGDVLIPGVVVTGGVAFTPAGDLITSGFKRNSNADLTHHVYRFSATGVMTGDLDLGIPYFARNDHVDVDRLGKIYVATHDYVYEVSSDLLSFRPLEHILARPSGVAVGGERLFATDQEANRLVVWNSARMFEKSFSYGNVPTGLALTNDGRLWGTSWSDGTLREILVESNSSKVILSGLIRPADIAFASDGSYYLSLGSGEILQHHSANNEVIASISTGPSAVDAIVVMIPEPATALMGLAGPLLCPRRKPRGR